MAWVTLRERASVATREVFGQAATLVLAGRPAETVDAVLDQVAEVISIDELGVPISARRPVLDVRLADLTTIPVQGDAVTVGGLAYAVSDVQQDGQGGARLYLVRT